MGVAIGQESDTLVFNPLEELPQEASEQRLQDEIEAVCKIMVEDFPRQTEQKCKDSASGKNSEC